MLFGSEGLDTFSLMKICVQCIESLLAVLLQRPARANNFLLSYGQGWMGLTFEMTPIYAFLMSILPSENWAIEPEGSLAPAT
ncbi:hypothetical protein BgiBS90_032925 [Biomphalaria glabrata]|nr:hypothetical protein BgiMline_033182 [Biomphalaria glabrata]KAI8747736.1 hypothetical protein BgiBS90_032925 [Biomphalaria glabrata]